MEAERVAACTAAGERRMKSAAVDWDTAAGETPLLACDDWDMAGTDTGVVVIFDPE
jgi:hypothetical protein